MLLEKLKTKAESYTKLLDILSDPEYLAILSPEQQVAFLNMLNATIVANDKLLIKMLMLIEDNPCIEDKALELMMMKQNTKLEKLCKTMILWLQRRAYKDYYRMNEITQVFGFPWRNLERYAQKGFIKRIKVGHEIKISKEQIEKAMFITNCKKILSIPNKTAVGIYENETERQYWEAKILQKNNGVTRNF